MDEDDWDGWRKLMTEKTWNEFKSLSDDLFVTNQKSSKGY